MTRLPTTPDLVTRAYGALRDLIIAGTLAPGTRIIETELAERLGISRTPLRSGLDRILQAKMGGLVVVGDGPEVLNICSGGFLLDAAFDAPRFSGTPSYLFMGPPDVAKDLRAMGFDALGRANNHLYDYGPEGMLETNAHLDEAGIAHSGSGPNYGAARAPRYLMTGKGRVGRGRYRLGGVLAQVGPAQALQAVVKKLQHFILQHFIKINKHIPAHDQLEFVKRAIRYQVVRR